jgi:hypothetical protein
MTVPNRSARPRIEREIDDDFLRRNPQTADCVIMLALLSTIDLTEEPKALDLICDICELRAGRAPEAELHAWGERARAWLLRLIGDAPVATRPLVN